MAAVSDCFSIGSTVACTTCFNQNIEGEVLAFDQSTKMLILKCPSARDSVKLSDVYIVNLSLCSDVQVKKEVSTIPDVPQQSLNLQRLSTRVRNAVEQKKRLVSALAAGVSPEGQKLYMFISKTISQVMWSGPNIVVFNDVTINPPYKKENVSGNPESRDYIQKIVEKFTKDQAAVAATVAASSSSAVGSSGSSSSVASSTSASTVSAN